MDSATKRQEVSSPTPNWCFLIVVISAFVGISLVIGQAFQLSTTYDELTYIQVAAHWWRSGEQSSITMMGSPLTFWKLQQVPTLWLLDRLGLGNWVDDPVTHQEEILPLIRIGGAWIWLASFFICVAWARQIYGSRSMAMAATLFALSPNLLAHGALATMELPLVASTSAMFLGFWWFLRTGKSRYFWATATVGGLAMSCKFTTILIPPILAILWAIDLGLRSRLENPARPILIRCFEIARKVSLGMLLFAGVMVASNLVVTGFALIPLSPREGDHPVLEGKIPKVLEGFAGRLLALPLPQDWVGFATQVIHQRNGGPSYLFGERRLTGWTHYYLVTLAVKVPLAFWLLFASRLAIRHTRSEARREWILPVIMLVFVLAAMIGSKRNYGFRYLLPLAIPAIVWVSSLAEGGRWSKRLAVVGLVGMAVAEGTTHPHELSYFNEMAGGPIGGRKILADSNLDWGQGAKSLARLQRLRPIYRDLTLFYFGDIDPARFGVEGRRIIFDANHKPDGLPNSLTVETPYLAVSASLQWGPWGPESYFRELNAIKPVEYTDDKTIAIYQTSDLRRGRGLE